MMKKLFIKTYGCQMNVYDSMKMAELLKPHGFEQTYVLDDADIAIFNTCHIREKAAEKVYAELDKVKKIKLHAKRAGKDMLIAVAGCVAQAEGYEVFNRAPYVDIVVGPQSYHNLPTLIENIKREKSWAIDLEFTENTKFDKLQSSSKVQNVSTYLTIQEGCDKFCHFCVVPYTRGAEYSRPVHEIYREAQMMVHFGAKEITLLGQNVSAYCSTVDSEQWRLGRLIKHLATIKGLERIRYTTSHPKDMIEQDLFMAHAEEPKLMPFVHLPIQSGSNAILKAMNRKHDRNFYLRIIETFKKVRPDIAFSSDFIVGYPGETDRDFIDTLDLVREIGYAQCYSFKYSPRPGTPAAVLDNQIPETVKKERLAELQKLLAEQQLAFNKSMAGSVQAVLLYKAGKKENQLIGKSPYMQSVFVHAGHSMLGHIADVRIIAGYQNSLESVLISHSLN